MQRLKDGFSLGEVSSVGGHADLQTTMNSYAKDSAEKLSEIVKGKKVQGQFIRIAGEEVLERKGRKWSGREDLNLRHLTPHASALPGCATPRYSEFSVQPLPFKKKEKSRVNLKASNAFISIPNILKFPLKVQLSNRLQPSRFWLPLFLSGEDQKGEGEDNDTE